MAKLLEKGKRFSKSLLWKYQQDFFDREGINAWSKQVPFYITSNPFIGHGYAKLITAYLLDLIKQDALDLNAPIYLFELGTGTGCFSFYCLKALREQLQQLQLGHLDVCYVMTDFTLKNLQYWEAQPQLKPYFDAGQLDCAIFNLETDHEITLVKRQQTLSAGSLDNPVIAIANYIFDTITHDAFSFVNGKGSELLTELKTAKENLKDDRPVNLDKVDTLFTQNACVLDQYYSDPHLNAILLDYQALLKDTATLIPVGAVNAFNTLRSWSGDRILVISTDKGYANASELDHLADPKVVFHGSFSMMVNFHAFGEYVKKLGGRSHYQSTRKTITTCCFQLGDTDPTPQLDMTSTEVIDGFSPGDFFNMHTHLKKTKKECGLPNIVSHLRLSRWDPYIYRIFGELINQAINDTDNATKTALIEGMKPLEANIYELPSTPDTYFDIGIFYHTIENFSLGLHYYQKSLASHGDQATTLFNMGLCHYALKALPSSLECLQRAKVLDPEGERTVEWIAIVEREM